MHIYIYVVQALPLHGLHGGFVEDGGGNMEHDDFPPGICVQLWGGGEKAWFSFWRSFQPT